jgi:alpha-tubulin suppressor-like RCC1 family protein
VTTLGAAKCWGDGGGGTLGDGKWQSSTRPVTVSGLSSGVVDISAGDHHTCAVLNTGAARCWGYGGHGELGDGLASGSGVPVTPVGLTANVVQIGAGEQHTCARMNGGGIKCWGDNYWGQLATGNQTWSSVPVNTVAMGGSAAQLTVGGNGNCILTAGGGVQCWGIRSLVGDGTDVCYNGVPPNGDPWITRPRWIKNMTSFVTDVSAGYGHACAVQSGGVWCWGDGRNGQLGNGQTPPLETCTPVGVTGLGAGVARVSVGKSHTIALLSGSAQAAGAMEDDLGVRAWGANNLGQLGDGTTNTAMTPVQVVPPRFYTRLPVVLR